MQTTVQAASNSAVCQGEVHIVLSSVLLLRHVRDGASEHEVWRCALHDGDFSCFWKGTSDHQATLFRRLASQDRATLSALLRHCASVLGAVPGSNPCTRSWTINSS